MIVEDTIVKASRVLTNIETKMAKLSTSLREMVVKRDTTSTRGDRLQLRSLRSWRKILFEFRLEVVSSQEMVGERYKT